MDLRKLLCGSYRKWSTAVFILRFLTVPAALGIYLFIRYQYGLSLELNNPKHLQILAFIYLAGTLGLWLRTHPMAKGLKLIKEQIAYMEELLFSPNDAETLTAWQNDAAKAFSHEYREMIQCGSEGVLATAIIPDTPVSYPVLLPYSAISKAHTGPGGNPLQHVDIGNVHQSLGANRTYLTPKTMRIRPKVALMLYDTAGHCYNLLGTRMDGGNASGVLQELRRRAPQIDNR